MGIFERASDDVGSGSPGCSRARRSCGLPRRTRDSRVKFRPMLSSRASRNARSLCGAVIAVVVVGVGAAIARADDLCPQPASVLADASIAFTGLPSIQDDVLHLAGRLAPGTAVDPASDGMTIVLTGPWAGTLLLEAHVSGGPGWIAHSGGWEYRDPRGDVAGVTRVVVKRVLAHPETFLVTVQAGRGDWANAAAARPLALTITFNAITTGAPCGTAQFSLARCRSTQSGRSLSCDPPRPPRRCSARGADSTVRCVALSVAAAQEVYFAAHGNYFSGKCPGVVDHTASGVLSCVAAGGQLGFVVTTAASNATVACVYSSSPSAGQPNLVCM